jgi:hypothetical protein
VDLGWRAVLDTAYYRVEVEAGTALIHQAFVAGATTSYRLPPFVVEKAAGRDLVWRVVAIDTAGHEQAPTAWQRLKG